MNPLALRIDAVLPQTQCTRCGYPDCSAYALAVAVGEANINQCPPGGAEGIARLAALTGRPVLPLSEEHGVEGPLTVAVIDEDWCIGCTLCIKACPTDAIVGSNKLMHTVVEPHCTGCELCLPVCPVDCISLVVVNERSGAPSGWPARKSSTPSAWRPRQRTNWRISPPTASTPTQRYLTRNAR
jgi:electron transport complex protein RnfB